MFPQSLFPSPLYPKALFPGAGGIAPPLVCDLDPTRFAVLAMDDEGGGAFAIDLDPTAFAVLA